MKGKALKSLCLVLWLLVVVSCTTPGETTGVGAATGGVIGAGLGAIVGSQTGDAGGGLVVGAMAGSGTGALVGNALEAQQEAIRTQDEAIERQQKTIRAQNLEIEELRRLTQDNVSFKSERTFEVENPRGPLYESGLNRSDQEASYSYQRGIKEAPAYEPQEKRQYYAKPKAKKKEVVSESEVTYFPRREEKRFTEQREPVAASFAEPKKMAPSDIKANIEWEQKPPKAKALTKAPVNLSAECQDAEKEVAKARSSREAPDKLFHYRRALRLCPENPAYHNGLGEIYHSLDRTEDARFEFQEALRLDPNYRPAKLNLGMLKSVKSNANY